MVKYSREPDSAVKSSKARGSSLRVHYQHMREISHTIMGMKLTKAKSYIEDVIEMKQIVPFTVYTGGVGRHAQAKLRKAAGNKGRWPVKASAVVLSLLKNAEANAEMKGLDVDNLYVTHAQANRAMKQRRRTYRAHGRTGPYMSNPSHIELILSEKDSSVQKGEEEDDKPQKLSRKAQARRRITAGGGD